MTTVNYYIQQSLSSTTCLKILGVSSEQIYSKYMPTTLARQNLICDVLQGVENDAVLYSESMDVNGDSSSESDQMYLSSSSSLLSSSSSSSSDAMSLGSTDDNDDSIYLASMFAMTELLEAILKTQVISPNEVVKCSQFILVLEIYVYHLTPLMNWSSESRTTRHSKITLT